MKLKIPSKNYNLVEFYERVATEMGYLIPDKLQFDCCKINVAANIQDGFYACYREVIKEKEPNASELDIMTGITMILAQCGPKVDNTLHDNEIEVFEGFIC